MSRKACDIKNTRIMWQSQFNMSGEAWWTYARNRFASESIINANRHAECLMCRKNVNLFPVWEGNAGEAPFLSESLCRVRNCPKMAKIVSSLYLFPHLQMEDGFVPQNSDAANLEVAKNYFWKRRIGLNTICIHEDAAKRNSGNKPGKSVVRLTCKWRRFFGICWYSYDRANKSTLLSDVQLFGEMSHLSHFLAFSGNAVEFGDNDAFLK